jgi:hypothetical protein
MSKSNSVITHKTWARINRPGTNFCYALSMKLFAAFLALIIIQYWRPLAVIFALLLVGQWIAENVWLAMGIVVTFVVAVFIVAWLAPAPKPEPVYPQAEINPDLLLRLESYRAAKRARRLRRKGPPTD